LMSSRRHFHRAREQRNYIGTLYDETITPLQKTYPIFEFIRIEQGEKWDKTKNFYRVRVIVKNGIIKWFAFG
jgi:hypothetical protein